MTRQLGDWLSAYLDYTSGTEAPRIMHFWCGVSALTSVLRRRVWIDFVRYKWYPSFYIILVAKPGIVSKTTTMDMAMDLVREVPGIKFGPDAVTWQSLVVKFAEAREEFLWGEDWMPMSPLTLASGELGNLLNLQDRDMMNFFITLWDCKSKFEKSTKGSGEDVVSAPWINLIGCTTPNWIADNAPRAMVGGGFMSRCVFVYADKKAAFVAYPDEHVRPDHEERQRALIHDLEHISTALVGPAKLTAEARDWGRDWYQKTWSANNTRLDDERLSGYLVRKQAHMHKLALVLSVSENDDLVITKDHLVIANQMLESIEGDLDKVFAQIGRTEDSMQVERLLAFIKSRGRISFVDAFKYIHAYFPDFRDFEGILAGLINSGQLRREYTGNGTTPAHTILVYTGG